MNRHPRQFFRLGGRRANRNAFCSAAAHPKILGTTAKHPRENLVFQITRQALG
jgi:hypothetical protein